MLISMSDVTRILSAIEQGDPHAAEQLLPLVYDELRRLAASKLSEEKAGQTLEATALVHEASAPTSCCSRSAKAAWASSSWPSRPSRSAPVALKIIKPGMDTRQVIARFEAERQALAMMDHPNIAKVLDAGTTDSGRPYFVMELVKGVPITEYCDEQPPARRAAAGAVHPVCQAVQHAHQKGIIHRDLKPSNVLVAARRPAGAQGHRLRRRQGDRQQLTDKTLFTGFGQMIGTPLYMSPEQASSSSSTSTPAATSIRWACCSTSC
jgi:serine/threonine protein kinase